MVRRALVGLVIAALPALGGPPPRAVAGFAPGTIPGTVRYQVAVPGVARDDVGATLGALENLEVVAGPLIEQRIAWEDGTTAAALVLTWVMRAARPGPMAVGPTRLALGDLVLTTERVRGRAMLPGQEDDGGARDLRVRLSRPRVVVGEALSAAFVVDPPVPGGEWQVSATFPQSWSEPLPDRRETPDAGVVAEWVVIPARPGAITIPPATAQQTGEGAARDGAGPRLLASRPATVEVRALPPSPPGFFGGVGQLIISRKVTPERLRVGDLATVEIEVRGRGNFPLMTAPTVELPDGVAGFPAEEQRDWTPGRDGLDGHRTWRFPIEAKMSGALVLPAARLATFRPGTGFVEHVLPSLRLEVESRQDSGTTTARTTGASPARSLPLPLVAGLAAALLAAAALLLAVRRRRPRRPLDASAELARLGTILERWTRERFGIGAEGGADALRAAGCGTADAEELAALHRALIKARLSPGLGDLDGVVASLRHRLEAVLARRSSRTGTLFQ